MAISLGVYPIFRHTHIQYHSGNQISPDLQPPADSHTSVSQVSQRQGPTLQARCVSASDAETNEEPQHHLGKTWASQCSWNERPKQSKAMTNLEDTTLINKMSVSSCSPRSPRIAWHAEKDLVHFQTSITEGFWGTLKFQVPLITRTWQEWGMLLCWVWTIHQKVDKFRNHGSQQITIIH